jgi:Flp pilus assembly protein TadG
MDKRIESRTEASLGARVNAPVNAMFKSLFTGRWAQALDERGQALLEFAYLLPILLILLLGMIAFGITMNNYLEMTNGVTGGAQALAVSRGQTLNPCTTVSSPVFAATPNLTQGNLMFTITIGPAPGGSGSSFTLASNTANPTCGAANTSSAPASDLTQGAMATVKVTYPCNLKVFGVNFAPSGCTLTAQTAESIQ